MKLRTVIKKEKGKIPGGRGWLKTPKLSEKTTQAWRQYTRDWSAWGKRVRIGYGYRPTVVAIYGDLRIPYSRCPRLFATAAAAEAEAQLMLEQAEALKQ